MSLVSYSVRRPVATIAGTLAIVLLGSVSLGRLPVSLLPDVTLPVLTIRTVYEGAAAEEVSRFVAEPIEESIAATPGLVELRSVSRNGEAMTTARFAWGTNMQATVLNVRERLDNARGRLPERAERPTLLTSDPGERPIAVLALTGPGDLRSLARAGEDVHARRLEQLAGVASVAVVGAPEDEIRIEVDGAHDRRGRDRRSRGKCERRRGDHQARPVPLFGSRAHRVSLRGRDRADAGGTTARRDQAP
jgi:HAE1 family hydrophobic/amphiphilic exporter-1